MTDIADCRRSTRDKIVRAAITFFDRRRAPLPCVVLDLSDLGARLHVHTAYDLPQEFGLRIEAMWRNHWCIVVWRNGDGVGVAFADFPPPADG